MLDHIENINSQLNDPSKWDNRELLTSLNQELKKYQNLKHTIDCIDSNIELIMYSLNTLLEDKTYDSEDALITEMSTLHDNNCKDLNELSISQLFSQENDMSNAYIDIQAGNPIHKVHTLNP